MDMLDLFSSMLVQASHNSPVEILIGDDIDGVVHKLAKTLKIGRGNEEPKDLQIEAVKRFWSTGRIDTLRGARLVAFGLAVTPFGDRRCLMEDKEFFGFALNGIDSWKGTPRQFRKCYQGLVRSYFDYDGVARTTPEVGKVNWRKLRDYLNQHAMTIRDSSLNPDWVLCSISNVGLFTESPCTTYASELAAGNNDHVSEIRQLLGISDSSWFTWELIHAQIKHATELNDKEFQAAVSGLLRLLGGNRVLRDRSLQILLNRYVKIPQPPQHAGLKDYAVASWGNPWLSSNQDAWGGVDSNARLMVSNWLKLEFIELFFTKLTEDHLGDTRRVKFWAKYVPAIEEIHFALGSHAMDSHDKDFVELREKLEGLTVELKDSIRKNNAFIMRVGDLLAVEFSGESNAFYGYSVNNGIPFDLKKPVSTPVNGKNSLKQSKHKLKLSHQDNVLGYADWEDRFEEELRAKFGLRPGVASPNRMTVTPVWNDVLDAPFQQHAQPPRTLSVDLAVPVNSKASTTQSIKLMQPSQSEQIAIQQPIPPAALGTNAAYQPAPFTLNRPFTMDNLIEFSMRTGYGVQDRSDKGGAVWVTAPNHIENIRQVLSDWGFSYAIGKGWWKKIV